MTAEGASYSVMVGAGETYFAAFLLALGYTSVAAGLITAVPMLAGGLLQLGAPVVTRRIHSYRGWIIACAFVQGTSFTPFVLAALGYDVPLMGLYAAAAVYWGAGMATSSAWNTWSDSLVPDSVKATYFARRARICQVFVLLGLLAAGSILRHAEPGAAVRAFAVLFVAAGVARWLSAAMFMLPRSSAARPQQALTITFGELMRRFSHSEDGKLLLYMLAVQVAAYLSAPFFTPYMLTILDLPYPHYAMLLACAFLGRIATLPVWGNLARTRSPSTLLAIGGIGIVPMSVVWVVTDSLPYLMTVQFIGGALWGAWELATALLVFSHIREEERASLLTLYNMANSVAIVVGSTIGAIVFYSLGPSRSSFYVLFAISCVGRAATVLFLRRISSVGALPVELVLRITAVRPMAGAILRPVLATLKLPKRSDKRRSTDGMPQ